MLKKLKLKSKLIGGFLTVAALCAFVGIYCIVQMRNSGADYNALLAESTANQRSISELNASFLKLRLDALRAYGFDSSETRASLRDNVRQSSQRVHAALSAYEKTVDTDPAAFVNDDRRFFAGVTQAIERYESAVVEPEMDAIAHDQAVRAKGTLLTTGVQIGRDFDDAMGQLLELNQKMAQSRVEQEVKTAATTTNLTALVILLVVLSAIALGIVLSLSIIRPMNQITAVAGQMARGEVAQSITYTSVDEIGTLADSFRTMATTIKDHALAAQAIAAGNVDITIQRRSEQDVMGKSLELCVANVKALVKDASMLANAAVEGKLDVRADASRHQGDFRKIVEGTNASLEAMAAPLARSIDHLEKLSKGITGEQITRDYKGEYLKLRDGFNGVFLSLNQMAADANVLVSAAQEGKLDTRVDTSRHMGDYRKIMEGINSLLVAVAEPVKVSANYVERISRGDIPEKITTEYKGDFNAIKQSLNRCIDTLDTLLKEMAHMAREHDEGDIDVYIDGKRFQGVYKDVAEGIDKMVGGHIDVKKKAMACIAEFGRGNFDAPLEKFPGKKVSSTTPSSRCAL